MMNPPVKFGIIGTGSAAMFHILGVKNRPECNMKFVAAHDINEPELNKFCTRQKFTPYSDLDKMLQSDIDAVLVTVPHYLHASMVKIVASAGKHILCEKPMACTLEECDEMITAAQKAHVKFMIAENHRFLPVHVSMKNYIDRGFLGNIFMAQTYEGAYDKQENFINPNIWHFTFDKGGGGVIADQGVHKFAFLNWLIGSEVDFAQAWGGKALNSPPNKGEDNAIIFLHYKSGAMAEASVTSTSVHPLTNRTEIHGTKGSMVEDHASEKPLQVFTNHPEAEKRGEYFYPQMEHGPFPKYYTIAARCEDTYFADCILNDKTPEFTPEQAKAAVAVVLLSYLSIKKGNQIARMDELRQIANNKQTKSILNGLEPFLQKNYGSMIWK